jgi:uncharacterized protein YndB with AHSA1/START domain
MSTESIEVSGIIHAAPERIYQAWLDSGQHAAMTGGQAATIDPNIGGRFSAWDGYIEGSTVELEPGRRIVQKWRTTEFPIDAADSVLEVRFEPFDNGTRVVFVQSEIPEGQATRYEESWRTYYLVPMEKYFSEGAARAEPMYAAAETSVAQAVMPAAKPKPKAAPKPAAKKAAAKAAPKKKAAKKKPAKKAKARAAARKSSAKKASRKGKSAKRRPAKRSARRGKR